MKLKIQIEMNNAAFADCGNGPEAARILHQLAEDIDVCDRLGAGDSLGLMDINGNRVGEAKVTR